MKIDDILKRYNLKYEDLTPDERGTLHAWLRVLGEGKVTLERVKAYVTSMRDAVEKELTEYPEETIIKIWFIKIRIGKNRDKELILKARLRNYMLLEAFLSTPEKAKATLERTMAAIAKPKEK